VAAPGFGSGVPGHLDLWGHFPCFAYYELKLSSVTQMGQKGGRAQKMGRPGPLPPAAHLAPPLNKRNKSSKRSENSWKHSYRCETIRWLWAQSEGCYMVSGSGGIQFCAPRTVNSTTTTMRTAIHPPTNEQTLTAIAQRNLVSLRDSSPAYRRINDSS